MSQPRAKEAVHVSFTEETLAMADSMAQDDAATGDKPDRSRLVRKLVTEEWKRRVEVALATAQKPGVR